MFGHHRISFVVVICCLSTLSNDISSEADLVQILSVASPGRGLKVCVFYENHRLFSMVAMATWSFHRLIVGKIEKWYLLPIYCKYLDNCSLEMFLK